MDQKLLLLINREWTHPALDWSMAILSSFDLWLPVVAVAVIVLAIRGSFRVRAFLVVMAVIVSTVDGELCKTLKRMTDRPRPHQALDGIRQVELAKAKPRMLALLKPIKVKMSERSEADVEGRSFPSSHAANTMAAAMAAAWWFPRRGSLAFLVPLLVGYSRIYTGSHYPSDVLGGFVIAAAWSLGVLYLARPLWTVFGRWFPRFHERHPDLYAPSAA